MLDRWSTRSDKRSLLSRYSETMGELALRKRSELAMRIAKTEAELASKAKSAFLGTMSHELRTPLNAIIGFSDLIQTLQPERRTFEKSADYAEQIGKAGRHLLDVVSDILDISKIESGTFQLNLDTFSVEEIIEDTLPLVRERIAAKSQTLDLRLKPDLPDLTVDARRVRQILINLLSNANKFTPDGGRILISARRTKIGGATIAVVDSGIGMTPEQIAIAFKPFGQVQSTYSRSQEGTGLGLSIAIGLVKQHGGELYLESEPDVGTAAIVTFPPARAGTVVAPLPPAPGGGERGVQRRGTLTPKKGGA